MEVAVEGLKVLRVNCVTLTGTKEASCMRSVACVAWDRELWE